MDYLADRIQGTLKLLSSLRHEKTRAVDEVLYRQLSGYGERDNCFDPEACWVPFGRSDTWGGHECHVAFKTDIVIPEEYKDKRVVVSMSTGATDIWNTDNPQFLVYVDGTPRCGHDMNHYETILCEKAVPGTVYEYGLYAYSNMAGARDFMTLDISAVDTATEQLYYDMRVPFEIACLMKETDMLRGQYLKVLNDAVSLLDLRSPHSACYQESVEKCDRFLREKIYNPKTRVISADPISDVTVSSVGHTHIDVAWKWPLRQTREKALRSFSTVLYEMEHFPEYKFMSSQPQLYQFVKEESPVIFEKIRQRVAEGRWEPEGAMYVEADCNLTSGESLIRQILYGERFFEEEFGRGSDNEVLWLPDVFGYSAAMPQILKKSGIKYFMTTKIGWNEYNKIPNDTFMWKGIDGTDILTYFITTKDYVTNPETTKTRFETTYNGRQNPNQIMGTWQRYQNKDINKNVLTCYGFGDGGGGATMEMLEMSRRMEKGLPGCPRTKQSHVKEFFHTLEKNLEGKEIPSWNGELYLEYHRGTYTSMARNKKYNRLMEITNEAAESFSTLALMAGGLNTYPKSELRYIWQTTLLNQFHDILPGSSIYDVYEDSKQQYEEIFGVSNMLKNRAAAAIVCGVNGSGEEELSEVRVEVLKAVKKSEEPETKEKAEEQIEDIESTEATEENAVNYSYKYVFNSTSFVRNEIMETEGFVRVYDIAAGAYVPSQVTIEEKTVWEATAIPAYGYKAYRFEEIDKPLVDMPSGITYDKDQLFRLHTLYYHICFNQDFEIVSIYDKENQREILKKGVTANHLVAFEDRPKEYDAWNVDEYYREKSWAVTDVQSVRLIEAGPVRFNIEVKRRYMNSRITQNIFLYATRRRIDFKTTIDWQEQQTLLKTFFPLDLVTNKATYEIQYGNVERPTHKNTSWDQARFEVCAHKWADMSEAGYGVALLNDCKYGYSADDTTLSLTLLKSGIFPNPSADKEVHEFTYSLLPHSGSYREGNVVGEGYALNYPLTIITGDEPKVAIRSFFQDLPQNVVLETVKLPEETSGQFMMVDDEDNGTKTKALAVILRLYEAWGSRTQVKLFSHYKVADAFLCDLRENTLESLETKEQAVLFTMKPFEIKTIKLILKE